VPGQLFERGVFQVADDGGGAGGAQRRGLLGVADEAGGGVAAPDEVALQQ
jgi:hypothetical protein